MSRKNKLPDEKIAQIVHDVRAGLDYRTIAAKHGVGKTSVVKYANRYKAKGLEPGGPPNPRDQLGARENNLEHDGTVSAVEDRPLSIEEMMEIFKIDPKYWVPRWCKANVWQGFYKLKDGVGHKKVNLVQTKVAFERVCRREWIEAMEQVAKDHITPIRKRKRGKEKKQEESYAVSWGMWDAHFGMMAWRDETGNHYDLEIAEDRAMDAVDELVEELARYPIGVIWMPIGNDLMHFDNQVAQTTFGDHHLDADTRFGKVWQVTMRVQEYFIEQARELAPVDAFFIPGNHDYQASYCMTHCLAQRYRNDDRVEVDTSENPRKYRRWGGTLIGFDHGKNVKPQRLCRIMPEECRASWGETTYREWQIGHTHQRREDVYPALNPTNGISIRTHPSLSGHDFWHHHQGFIGEPMKSMEAFRYDTLGFRGSHVAWCKNPVGSVASTIIPDAQEK